MKDGGQAFPGTAHYEYYKGMTLRDYFAIHAPDMPDQWYQDSKHDRPSEHWADADSAWRYFHADAMIKARGKI